MITVEEFVPTSASDAELRAFYDVDIAIDREVEPDDPTPPFERAAIEYRDPPSWTGHRRWVARDAEAIVGRGFLELNYLETNRYIAGIDVGVVTSRRGEGIATRILAPMIAAAAADGRTVLETWSSQGTSGDAFAAHLGMETRYVERRSRLLTADVDRSMLEDWITRAKERASDYMMFGFDDACPEDIIDEYVAVNDVMNTAPREELDMEDEHYTPDRVRERDARAAKRGDHLWSLMVRHDSTGHLAGYTEIEWQGYVRDLVWQGGTAVDPAHRNNGLGRWLKAAMLQRLLDERPEVAKVDTWNAGSNEPMLAINVALGFRPAKYYNARQISADALAAAVATKS
jgi:GNAT superfamily N-acetyltransferase